MWSLILQCSKRSNKKNYINTEILSVLHNDNEKDFEKENTKKKLFRSQGLLYFTSVQNDAPIQVYS